jgi:hypothetical protein
LFLLGVFITSYWTKAGEYRYAWHSLYFKRNDAAIHLNKLPIKSVELERSENPKDFDQDNFDKVKDLMLEFFNNR